MEPRKPELATTHSDLLPGYALGMLTPSERRQVETTLAVNPGLRAELATYNRAVSALAMSVEPAAPSSGLRDRLAAAVAADVARGWAEASAAAPARTGVPATPVPAAAPTLVPTASPAPMTPRRRPTPINVWALVAAALLLVAIGAVGWGVQQRQSLAPVRTVAFTMSETMAGASGEIAVMAAPTPMMMMNVDNLPNLAPDEVYEVWLIPHDGAPIPAGTFTDTSMQHAMTGDAANFAAVAITVEPGPLGTTAPTTEPFAVAALVNE